MEAVLEYQELLKKSFGDGIKFNKVLANELTFTIDSDLLVPVCSYINQALGAPLVDMIGTDEIEIDGSYKLYYVFALEPKDLFLVIQTKVDPSRPLFPSVTPHVHAAHWYEREVKDMLGIQPVGHPDPRRLIRHNWSKEVHPLRKDIVQGTRFDRTDKEFPFKIIEGEGVFQIPVGPIHAGIIEPGHFRFSVLGEYIINLEAKLFYTHRGIEKLVEGMSIEKALLVSERICGACSYSHSTAYCQAIEKIAAKEIPERAKYIRTLLMELERLYNHIGDVGNICAGTGFAFGTSQGSRLKEILMRLNEIIAGNRYLRGVNTVGGVKKNLTPETINIIKQTTQLVEKDFNELAEILMSTDSLLDRFATTGVLSNEVASSLNVVGPGGRASGINRDVRRDHPYAAYSQLQFKVPLHCEGDVLARVKVRLDEVRESFAIINQIIDAMPEGDLMVNVGQLEPFSCAMGYTESPRGENIHWVMIGRDNTIYRYRVRSASYTNWPAVALAVPGNMVPDFPLINKSFELCYSCMDR